MLKRAMLLLGRVDGLRAAMAAHSGEADGNHAQHSLPMATTAAGMQAALDELGVSLTRHQVCWSSWQTGIALRLPSSWRMELPAAVSGCIAFVSLMYELWGRLFHCHLSSDAVLL